MREKFPVITAVAALGVVVVLGFWMYFTMSRPPASEPQTVSAPPASGRSVRVEERLQMLRESYARQQQVAAAPKADAPSATQKPETGTRSRAGWHAGNAGMKAATAPAAPPQAQRASPAGPPTAWVTSDGRVGGSLNLRPAYLEKNPSPDELEATILHGTDRRQRMEALDQLALQEPDEALRVLNIALLEENLDPDVYVGVIDALSDYADDISPEMIAPALRNPNANVRFEAVSLLGDMDSAAARTALQGATRDPDPEVRELAKGILEISH
jgi:HEAT repeat protein